MDLSSLCLIFVACNTLYFLVPSLLVFLNRKEDIISKRCTALLLTSALSTLIISTILILSFQSFNVFNIPCLVHAINLNLFVPITGIVYLTRALHLVYENCRCRINVQGTSEIKFTKIDMFTNFYFSLFKSFAERSKQPTVFKLGKATNRNLEETLTNLQEIPSFAFRVTDRITIASILPFLGVFIVLLVVPLSIFWSEVLVADSCSNVYVYTPAIIYLFLTLLVMPFILYSIVKIKDGLEIRNELLGTSATTAVLMVLYIMSNYIPNMSPELTGNEFYGLLICYITHFYSTIYPLLLCALHSHRKQSLNIDTKTYSMVINDSHLFEELKALMAKEMCLENALFIEEFTLVKNEAKRMLSAPQSKLFETPIETNRAYLQGEIAKLYDRFIAVGAPFELNLPSSIADKIEAIITGKVHAELDVFECVLSEVHRNV